MSPTHTFRSRSARLHIFNETWLCTDPDWFRKWYVDGRLPYHVIIDEANPKGGIKELRYIDPLNLRKVKEIQTKPDDKTGAEMIVKSYFKSFKLPVITVRANNIYGIRQFPEKIIPRFSLRALSGLPLELHGDGSNLRHYLAASDFAKALELLAINGECGEAYNIASEVELSNLEMANLINSIIRPNNNEVRFTSDRPFNDSRYQVDDSKIRNLGWKPKKSIIEDLPSIIDWYNLNSSRYSDVSL